MHLLPLKLISDADRLIVGDELVSLAGLQRKGLPVAETYILFPPDHIHQEMKILHPQLFKKRLEEKFNWEVLKELEKILDLKKIQNDILEAWISQHLSKSKNLKPLPIVISPNIKKSGQTFINSDRQIEILPEDHNLSIDQLAGLGEIIQAANKYLVLSYLYHWVFDGRNFKILRLQPLTLMVQGAKVQEEDQLDAFKPQPKEIKVKSSTKILVTGHKYFPDSDGNFLETEQLDQNEADEIASLAKECGPKPILLRIKDLNNPAAVKPILNLKNQLKLYNISLVVSTRNLAFLESKFHHGIKLNLEMSVPENIINLDKYIEAYIDGVIIDADKLAMHLLGDEKISFDPYTIIQFLDKPISLLHKNAIPFWVMGENCLNDELLKYLVSRGVTGLILDENILSGAREQLRFMEKANLASVSPD